MRFCTTCGSPVSGMLRFCTRCGAATSSTAAARVTTVAATGTAEPGPAEGRPGRAGSLPVTPAQAGVTEAGAPGPAPQDSPAPPATAQPTGRSEDAEPLRLVRIDAEPSPEASPEDPWLPGSRRPDRRALIIGVVLIAGLLSVASTAWLIGVNPPQASSPHGTHQSRPSQLGPGRAQPGQALSGQPDAHPDPAQPARAQPTPAQPAYAHPDRYEPAATRADRTQPVWTQPARARPEQRRPPGIQPERDGDASDRIQPARPGPDGARPGLQPARLRPERARPGRPGSSGSGHPGPAHPAPAHPALAAAPARRPRTRAGRLLGPGAAGRIGTHARASCRSRPVWPDGLTPGGSAGSWSATSRRSTTAGTRRTPASSPGGASSPHGISPGATGPAMTRTPYWSGSLR